MVVLPHLFFLSPNHRAKGGNVIDGAALPGWRLVYSGLSAVVLVDRGGVTAQRCHGDIHVGEQRQVADQLLQPRVVLHVEDTDVGVAASYPPQRSEERRVGKEVRQGTEQIYKE